MSAHNPGRDVNAARAMFSALDDARDAARYSHGYRLGAAFAERLITELPEPAPCAIEGVADGLARFYRGALPARLRLLRELRGYIVETVEGGAQ